MAIDPTDGWDVIETNWWNRRTAELLTVLGILH